MLRHAQLGDVAAVHDLYSIYAPSVRGYLRGQGVADADDLTSEVFIGMMRNLETFEGDEPSFRSWLFVIAHRRVLDDRRRSGRSRVDSVDPGRIEAIVGTTIPGAGDEAIDRLHQTLVLDALAQLTDAQRAVVLLHTIGGLPLKQVAMVLSKEVGAVKSIHRRALAAVIRSDLLAHLTSSDES